MPKRRKRIGQLPKYGRVGVQLRKKARLLSQESSNATATLDGIQGQNVDSLGQLMPVAQSFCTIKLEELDDLLSQNEPLASGLAKNGQTGMIKIEGIGNLSGPKEHPANKQSQVRGTGRRKPREIEDVSEAWFWKLPALHGETTEPPVHGATEGAYRDLDGDWSDEFFLILDAIYQYAPHRNVDNIVAALKPRFLERIYNSLTKCELPSTWTVARNDKFVQLLQISDTANAIVQKSVVVDGGRNVQVYVHNKLITDLSKRGIKTHLKVQITQRIQNTRSELLKLANQLAGVRVCCGNFEADYWEVFRSKSEHAACKTGYAESGFQDVAGDGRAYSRTVRAKNCSFIPRNGLRCKECAKLRQLLYGLKHETLGRTWEYGSPKLDISFGVLDSERNAKRLQNLSAELNRQRESNRKLKKKFTVLSNVFSSLGAVFKRRDNKLFLSIEKR